MGINNSSDSLRPAYVLSMKTLIIANLAGR
jgi:hypothetical protein